MKTNFRQSFEFQREKNLWPKNFGFVELIIKINIHIIYAFVTDTKYAEKIDCDLGFI
jgi:hypothetical protein